MKFLIKAAAVATCFAAAACDVDQTKEGELPDVDVNVSEGQLPEFNVQGPDVDVGTKNETIQVPTIDVDTPKD